MSNSIFSQRPCEDVPWIICDVHIVYNQSFIWT